MEQLLTIGEVAKIKLVSHRMLRYYDKLGLLKPAHINEENGYRYYSKSQLVILDLILVCTELGIPLKNVNSFINEQGEYCVKQIVEAGEVLAKEKMKKTKGILNQLELMKQYIDDLDINYIGDKQKEIPNRFLYKKEISLSINVEQYWQVINELYAEVERKGYTSYINAGQYIKNEKGIHRYFAFVRIKETNNKDECVEVIPAATYTCCVYLSDEWEQVISKVQQQKWEHVIIEDLLDKTISEKSMPIELQIKEGITNG